MSKPHAPARPGRRRFRTAMFVGLLLSAIAWFVVLPAVVRVVATETLSAALGARVELDSARWSGGRTVHVRGMRVVHPDTGEGIAEIAEADAEFAGSPLVTPRRLEALAVRGSRVYVSRSLPALRPGPAPVTITLLRLHVEDVVVEVRPDPETDDTWSIPVETLTAEVRSGRDMVWIEEVQARMCGGTVEGRGSMPVTGSGPLSVHTTFTGIDLAVPFESSRVWNGRVGGRASGSLAAEYAAGELVGTAQVEAVAARLWALPVFRDLARALEVDVTPESRFDHCSATMAFQGDRVVFEDLSAEGGDPMDVTGKGVLKLDGSGMYVELAPRILHTENVPIIGKPTQAITDLLGGVAVTVCMSGPPLAPRIEVKHGKPITDAIQGVLDVFK